MNINILMIEDDVEFAEIITEYLAQYNMKVTNYDDPYLGLSAGIKNFDLLILDLTLPGLDGLEVCKEVVQKYDIPIIISSARSDLEDKIVGLQLGADDYLPKPYDPKEMYARIISLIRRYKKSNSKEEEHDSEFRYDKEKHQMYLNNKPLQLTPGESEILSHMLKYHGHSISREQLVQNCNSLKDRNSKSLDVIIGRLRAKIGDDSKNPKYIQSIRGVGYKLIG